MTTVVTVPSGLVVVVVVVVVVVEADTAVACAFLKARISSSVRQWGMTECVLVAKSTTHFFYLRRMGMRDDDDGWDRFEWRLNDRFGLRTGMRDAFGDAFGDAVGILAILRLMASRRRARLWRSASA